MDEELEFIDVDFYTLVYKKPGSVKHYCEGKYIAPVIEKDNINTYFKMQEFLKDLEKLRDEMVNNNPGYICAVVHYTATVVR